MKKGQISRLTFVARLELLRARTRYTICNRLTVRSKWHVFASLHWIAKRSSCGWSQPSCLRLQDADTQQTIVQHDGHSFQVLDSRHFSAWPVLRPSLLAIRSVSCFVFPSRCYAAAETQPAIVLELVALSLCAPSVRLCASRIMRIWRL